MRILMVEHDIASRTVPADGLEKNAHEVLETGNCAAARAELQPFEHEHHEVIERKET